MLTVDGDGAESRPQRTTSEGGAWWVILPVVGMLACCGGPALVAWLAATGAAAALADWWVYGGKTWLVVAVGVAALMAGLWQTRKKMRR